MPVKEKFIQTNKIYHYTSIKTALMILDSKRLRFGRLNNTNDIHENDKLIFVDTSNRPIQNFSEDLQDAIYDELYKYRQISFSIDSKPKNKFGFDLHQMWGLYADKCEGVCLVFDKIELKQHYSPDVISNNINYIKEAESYHLSFSKNIADIPNEIKSQSSKLFFNKRLEWEHEQEFRILKRCVIEAREEYLCYGKALKYVIISSRLSNVDEVQYSNNINEIRAKAESIPILIYGNGLMEYSLCTLDGQEEIWNSSNQYDVPIIGENCKLDI